MLLLPDEPGEDVAHEYELEAGVEQHNYCHGMAAKKAAIVFERSGHKQWRWRHLDGTSGFADSFAHCPGVVLGECSELNLVDGPNLFADGREEVGVGFARMILVGSGRGVECIWRT